MGNKVELQKLDLKTGNITESHMGWVTVNDIRLNGHMLFLYENNEDERLRSPEMLNGSFDIQTSPVRHITRVDDNEHVVTTHGSFYKIIGKPAAELEDVQKPKIENGDLLTRVKKLFSVC